MSSMGQYKSHYDPPAPDEAVGLTPWFSVSTPPVRPGWYEVFSPSHTRVTRHHWNGSWYGDGRYSVSVNDHWRGMFKEDEVWKTQDGRRLKVGDMSGDHARNVLRLLLKTRRQKMEEWLRQQRREY